MKRNISKLITNQFDVVVVGGGITGACLAHDATLRGLRVALVEKSDFGMATSAASSKLLHGGIRYLQTFQFGKVRESARERNIFQVIAPHNNQYVPFIIPTIQGNLMKGAFAMRVGMFLYRLVCSGLNKIITDKAKIVPNGKFLSKSEVLKLVPFLNGIVGMNGAHTLFESHMHNSERMTLAFLKTAQTNGAQIANHVEVVRFQRRGSVISGVVCRDELDGKEFEVRCEIVVNAAGPYIPQVNKFIAGLHLKKSTTGYSKGVHLVTRNICEDFALAISSGKKTEGLVTRGGRHFFVIPWRNCSLIGTTNVPYGGELDKLTVTKRDVTDFLDDINYLLPSIKLQKKDIYYAFTGLYPLVSGEIKHDTYQGTGTYQIVDHGEMDCVEGLISVLGAKYTTGRIVAEKAVDLICKKMGKDGRKCKTDVTPLIEGKIDDLAQFVSTKIQRYAASFSAESIQHLVRAHGSNLDKVVAFLQREQSFTKKLTPNRETFVGEIHYAVEVEMACTLSDVVFARTGLGTIGHPGKKVLLQVARIMAEKLNWDEALITAEIVDIEKQYSCLA